MRLMAGLAAGLCVYVWIGTIVGITPRWLRRTTDRRVRGVAWHEWLRQADADVTPAQFAAVSAALGLVVGVTAGLVVRVPALGAVAGLAGCAIPRMVFARRRETLMRGRLAAWPDTLRDMITHLRSSLSLHASLCELGRSGPLPLRPSFNRYAGLAGALDQRTALEVMREDLADPISDRVIEVLLVAFDQGSSVVIDVLGDLASSTSEDLRLLEEIETLQLETKLEARGAAVLPFLVLGMLCVFTPGYRAFYSTSAGWLVVGLGAVMSVGGLLAITRLGRVPTEERILAVGTPT
jgi:tight adherence protein B